MLPCRSRQSVYERLEAACKQARVKFKGVHALRHASGTRLKEETGDLALVADHLRHTSMDTARGYEGRQPPAQKGTGRMADVLRSDLQTMSEAAQPFVGAA